MKKANFSLFTAASNNNNNGKKARVVTTLPENENSRSMGIAGFNWSPAQNTNPLNDEFNGGIGFGNYNPLSFGTDVTSIVSSQHSSITAPSYTNPYSESLQYRTNDEINEDIYDVDAIQLDEIVVLDHSHADGVMDRVYNNFAMPWDPRIGRANSVFLDNGSEQVLYPFASNTVATCYEDMVFHLPKNIGNYIEEAWRRGYQADEKYIQELAAVENGSTGDGSTGDNQQNPPEGARVTREQSATEKANIDILKSLWSDFKSRPDNNTPEGYRREHPYGDDIYRENPDMMGAQSIMNPYSITRLVGAFDYDPTLKDDEEFVFIRENNHLYDIRDSRRFYDIQNMSENYNHILMPTTTNIIHMSNSDIWGRTPYTFQDFVFCKWWNRIPNNRLLTLRKYASPVADNLNFPGMKPNNDSESASGPSYDELITQNKSGISKSSDNRPEKSKPTFPPIVTLVGYMGDETGNKISDLLSFSAGVNWEEIKSEMHNVTGEEGSDPREIIDSWSSKGSGFFAEGASLDYGNGILNQLTSGGSLITSKLVGVNKFVSMFTPGGFRDVSKASLDKLKSAQMDPQADGPYNNRIEGPLNRIDKVWKRKEGITFGHSIKLKFDYIARPVGGMNTKAVMLDIMANCLMMGASDAVFWGGGHRFNIEYANHYCYSGFNEGNDFMMKLYNGKLFGSDGAIAAALTGIKNIGTGAYGGGDGTGNFSFSNVTSLLGGVLKSALGGLGSVLKSAVSAVFGNGGISNAVNGVVDGATSALGITSAEIDRGNSWIDSIKNNLEGLWSSKMLQATTFPKISGYKAILTGEPVGPWHLTVGNPLNPMMVIGNLICKNVKITFGNELGPDDFPLEMSATYELEHGMIRDKAGIESMFNRGSGKIYKLPDYINSTSDFETKVDEYTGNTDFRKPHFANTPSSTIYSMAGAHGGYFIKNWDNAHTSDQSKDQTTVACKFIPHEATKVIPNRQNYHRNGYGVTCYIGEAGLIPIMRANVLQRRTAR